MLKKEKNSQGSPQAMPFRLKIAEDLSSLAQAKLINLRSQTRMESIRSDICSEVLRQLES